MQLSPNALWRCLLFMLLPLAGCASAPPRDPNTRATIPMTFIYLETGPNSASHTPEQKQEIFSGHMRNMRRLADEGTLLIAGPFGQPRNPAWRGIFIFDVPDVAAAERIAATDPGVSSGEFRAVVRPIAVSPTLRDTRRLENEWQAELKAGGGPAPTPGEPPPGLRRFVMMHAHDFARARLALPSTPRVIWSAAFADGRDGVFLLDAADVHAAAAPLNGPDLGAHGLDLWLSTKSLERLPADAR